MQSGIIRLDAKNTNISWSSQHPWLEPAGQLDGHKDFKLFYFAFGRWAQDHLLLSFWMVPIQRYFFPVWCCGNQKEDDTPAPTYWKEWHWWHRGELPHLMLKIACASECTCPHFPFLTACSITDSWSCGITGFTWIFAAIHVSMRTAWGDNHGCFVFQNLCVSDSFIPEEYHIVKNKGIRSLEFYEEWASLCSVCSLDVHRVIWYYHYYQSWS